MCGLGMGMALVKVQGAWFNSIETGALDAYCNAKPGCDCAHGQAAGCRDAPRKIWLIGVLLSNILGSV